MTYRTFTTNFTKEPRNKNINKNKCNNEGQERSKVSNINKMVLNIKYNCRRIGRYHILLLFL